jgi:diguanylate cyclase (GGDEF)-like protein
MPNTLTLRDGACKLRRSLRLKTLITVLLIAAGLLGRTSDVEAQRFEVRLFDQSDGLENLSITAFAQQEDGHLWIATLDGIFRYDGSVFTEFGMSSGLTDPTVYSLLIDHAGTLWAGTHRGLFRFDGHRFHEVRAGTKALRIGPNSMLAAAPQGELVVETSTGIFSVQRDPASGDWNAVPYQQRHPAFPDSQDTDGVAIGLTGLLWFGNNGNVCSFSGHRVQTYGPQQGVPKDYYVSLFAAHDGRMWARGRKHILTWRPGDTGMREVSATFPKGAMSTVYRRFAEDPWGRILTPTAKGFALWDGHAWMETTTTSAGSIGGATDIFTDHEHSIWIGTGGAGLLHSRGFGLWENYSAEQGLGSAATGSVAADRQGRVWVGTDLGVNILDPGSHAFRASPLDHHAEAVYIQALAPDLDGGMWAGALLGHIFHISARGHVDATIDLDAYIKRLLVDRKNTLWIITSRGLFQVRSDRWRKPPELLTGGGLGPDEIGDAVLAPDDSLWVATARGLDHVQLGSVTHFSVPALPEGVLNLCLDRDGTLWLSGHVNNVLHVRLEGRTARVIQTFALPNLTSAVISFLGADFRGRVWIGTDHGANVISGGRVFSLTDEDGLIRDDTVDRAFLPQTDGSVWIGTGKGASHLLNPDLALHRPTFAVGIEEAQYAGHSLLGGRPIHWSQATPSIRFSALTFRNSQKLLYHSQLLGFDTTETVSKDSALSYPHLPPGDYTFRVYAEDTGNGAVSAPAELSFQLLPPWWRTSWAEALAILLLLGLTAALWHLMNLALLVQQRKLHHLVKVRTAELQYQADHDSLTGLLNRGALFKELSREIDSASGTNTELFVAILDIDHFKRINDTFGHLAGDEILRQAGARLQTVARTSGSRRNDIIGRYGGEEFLIIFRDAKYTLGMARCESIRQAICKQPMRYQKQEIPVTCSIGLARVHTPPEPVSDLLAQADKALYCAKHKGRNLVESAEPLPLHS